MNILTTVKRFFGFPQPQAPPTFPQSAHEEVRKLQELFPATNAMNNELFPAREPNAELSAQLKGNKMNLLNLLKAIFEIVKLIEAALPDSPGREKLEATLELINDKAGAAVAAMPVVVTFVNGAVAVLNAFGVFRKKTPAA